MTNLIVLSIALLTNTIAGDPDRFKMVNGQMTSVRDVTVAFNEFSLGYLNGTNPVEVLKAQRLLWARTNFIVIGVGATVHSPPPIQLESNAETIKPK